MISDQNPNDLNSPKPKPRLRVPIRNQLEIVSASIDDLVEEDHQVRSVWAYACELDMSCLLKPIKAVEGAVGRNATDPRVLLTLWIYATIKGIGSARHLAELCKDHNAFKWICGGVSINHKTLSDFRSQKGEELNTLLKESVATLMDSGLVLIERVSQDGMRVRAPAGKASFRRPKTLQKCLKHAERQLDALKNELEMTPDEIDRRRRGAKKRAAEEKVERIKQAVKNQKKLEEQREKRKKGSGKETRVSTTDPEARIMKFSNGGFNPGYNVQYCTDNETEVILGVEVTNQGSDGGLLLPMAKRIEDDHGRLPKQYLADGGFSVQKDIEYLEGRGIEVYSPVKQEKEKLERGENPYLPLKRDTKETAAWKKRMGTEEAKEIYKERAAVAELVNAQSRNRNFWFFPTKGLTKAKAVATLFALTHNVIRSLSLRPRVAEAN